MNALVISLSRFVFTGKIGMLVFCALDLNVSMSLFYSFYVFLFNWRTFGLKNRYVTGLGETLMYAEAPQGEDEYERNFLTVGGFDSNTMGSQGADGAHETLEEDPLSVRSILVGAASGKDAAEQSESRAI